MISKEERENIKEYFEWVHEELSTYGSDNYINTETLDNKIYLLEEYIEQLESKLKKYELETIPQLQGEISASKQVHEYDVQMIDQVKRKSSRIIQYN